MKFLPKAVYFGHSGKRAFDVVQDFPGVGQYIKEAEDYTGYKPVFVSEPPYKKRKIIPKTMPTTMRRKKTFARRPVMRRRYKKRYGTKRFPRKYSKRRYHAPTAMNLTETKRYNVENTEVLLDTGQLNIISINGPLLNQDPTTDDIHVSTASGKQIYALGVTVWITIANESSEGTYTGFVKILKLDPNANGALGNIYYDSRTGDRAGLATLHHVDRYKARCHVGQGFHMLTQRAATLEPNQATNGGKSSKSFKIWLPIRKKMIWEDSKWNNTFQIRTQFFRTDGTTDSLLDTNRLTYSYAFFYKD